MELETLKYIWHSLETPPGREPDRRALLALLHRRSQGPVARMRRNLIGEGIVFLAAYIPAIFCFLLSFDGRLAPISWLFALVATIFSAYYYRKYRLLKKMQCPTCQVRSNLALQITALQKYTRFYLLAGTAMIPVTYTLAYLIVRWKLPAATSVLYTRLHPTPWWATPTFWLILLIPMTIAIYYSNDWYIKRHYGRHIKKLQDLLQEMETE
jgi:hypothetical protein